MYFIMLATGSTLHAAGVTEIGTAAQVAQALRPIAGDAAGALFAAGMVGVGLLAVPVMTAGAAYDLAQSFGLKYSLHAKWYQAKGFYGLIGLVTAAAVGLNFLGFNPMRALVWAGVVQGFSVPPLLLLIMLMTNSRRVMGAQVNKPALNVLGWATTGGRVGRHRRAGGELDRLRATRPRRRHRLPSCLRCAPGPLHGGAPCPHRPGIAPDPRPSRRS